MEWEELRPFSKIQMHPRISPHGMRVDSQAANRSKGTSGRFYLGCLLVDSLDFNFVCFYGLCNIEAKSLTLWMGPEDS